MGLFSSILEKLGIKSAAPAAKPAESGMSATAAAAAQAAAAAAARPAAVSPVDVVAKLEGLAAKRKSEKLDWKVSIVDLLKLLDLDSSQAARKELATELGCPPDQMGESAKMNTWLHKTVLRKLAENGGNIPKELL